MIVSLYSIGTQLHSLHTPVERYIHITHSQAYDDMHDMHIYIFWIPLAANRHTHTHTHRFMYHALYYGDHWIALISSLLAHLHSVADK